MPHRGEAPSCVTIRVLRAAAGTSPDTFSTSSGSTGVLLFCPVSEFGVASARGTLKAPRGAGLWIPASGEFRIVPKAPPELISVELHGEGFPSTAVVFFLPPLLRELLTYVCRGTQGWPAERWHCVQYLVAEQALSASRHFVVPLPRDPRLARVASSVLANPADDTALGAWGRRVGISARHMTRSFREETGLNFSQWRTRVRVQRAIAMLLEEHRVSLVARTLGYDSAAAFTRMFRRVAGQPPGRFARSGQARIVDENSSPNR